MSKRRKRKRKPLYRVTAPRLAQYVERGRDPRPVPAIVHVEWWFAPGVRPLLP